MAHLAQALLQFEEGSLQVGRVELRMHAHTRTTPPTHRRGVVLLPRQSPRSVRDKIAVGQLEAVRISRGPRAPIRIEEQALERLLEEGRSQ